MSKLTDRDTIPTADIDGELYIHVVDPKDTSEDPAGSSFKVQLANLAPTLRGYDVAAYALTQVDVQDPEATAVGANTIGTITWTYLSTGVSRGTCVGAFAGKMVGFAAVPVFEGMLRCVKFSDDVIYVYTMDTTGTLANGLLTDQVIEIRTYDYTT